MIDTVIIVRHGERLDKEDKAWPTTTPTPWDTPLSRRGFEQVKCLAEELKRADVSSPVTLYTSPFLRCVQTAAPIAAAFNIKLQMCSVFGEWMTAEYFEHGAPPNDNHLSIATSSKMELIRTHGANTDFMWDPLQLGYAGSYGETWREMHERASRGLAAALKGDGTLIIVSHGSLCNGMIADLRQVPQMEIIGMGEYVVIRR